MKRRVCVFFCRSDFSTEKSIYSDGIVPFLTSISTWLELPFCEVPENMANSFRLLSLRIVTAQRVQLHQPIHILERARHMNRLDPFVFVLRWFVVWLSGLASSNLGSMDNTKHRGTRHIHTTTTTPPPPTTPEERIGSHPS
jgi:hypothetical protein